MTAQRKITAELLQNELVFTTSRSSGPGGQNVNKVNSKVTLQFDVTKSAALTDEEKQIIIAKLRSRITGEGVLTLSAQDKRSQLQNKEEVLLKFDRLLAKAFEKRKKRKPTRPSKSAVQNRLKRKKAHSEKKKFRRNPGTGEG